jgi:hypothetical protein
MKLRRLRSRGGDVFDACLKAVNWEAHMLVIGFAAGRFQTSRLTASL